MKLPDKVYDFLKWTCLLFLPACAWLYSALSETWGLPYADQIPETINRVAFFIGVLIGVSTLNYNQNREG